MTEQISFATDAAIIDRLGQELVAKQTTALVELIKNAFDADATEVSVVFNKGTPSSLEIRDNGTGMSRNQLLNNFMRLATSSKVDAPTSKKFRRSRAGRKGIGRFATQRLGTQLLLTTRTTSSGDALQLSIDWSKFEPGKDLDQIKAELESVPWAQKGSGTVLRIVNLRDLWTPSQLKSCWRSVLTLQQPFPVAPVIGESGKDPGFSVKFVVEGSSYHNEAEVIDLDSELFAHLHALIEMEVDSQGAARWRITKNKFGDSRPWRNINHNQPESARPTPYTYLRNAYLKAYYFILLPELLPSLIYSRIRGVLNEQGGIRLYRNGFRVPPYGEQDNDWLHLDAVYAKRAVLVPLANRNFFGVIEVRDVQGKLFNEHTSREGLIETLAFVELKDLASSVLITAATEIGADREKKVHAGRANPPKAVSTGFEKILENAKKVAAAAAKAAQDRDPRAASLAAEKALEVVGLAAEEVQKRQRDEEEAQNRMADEAAMLRFLATLGMTTAEFAHETGMTFNAFRLDFQTVFEVALKHNSDKGFATQAERARSMLDRLDSLTSYLNSLAAARAARGMRPVSLSKVVEEFSRGLQAQAASQSVQLTIETPNYDPLYTHPMHEAEIASVLLNFYTNAIKAMKRSSNERKILLVADAISKPRSGVRLRFSDSGDGVPAANRDRIFDAFFTTRVATPGRAADFEQAAGTGLGLWIVKQIADKAGGSVSLSTPPKGYSTCFELVLPAEDDHGD